MLQRYVDVQRENVCASISPECCGCTSFVPGQAMQPLPQSKGNLSQLVSFTLSGTSHATPTSIQRKFVTIGKVDIVKNGHLRCKRSSALPNLKLSFARQRNCQIVQNQGKMLFKLAHQVHSDFQQSLLIQADAFHRE